MFPGSFFPSHYFAPHYFAVSLAMGAIVGGTGGIVEVRGGTGVVTPTISGSPRGIIGGRVEVRGGTTGALLPQTDRLITVFISGINRTYMVRCDSGDGKGVTRSLQISGGSKAACKFVLLLKPGNTYRPSEQEEVIIWSRGARWFAGVIDSLSETDYSGSSGIVEITVNCVDYGALCDRVIVGREYQPAEGQLASILFTQVTNGFLKPRLGIHYIFTYEPGIGIGDQVYNWITGTQVLNQICQASNCEWRIDWYKNLYLFPAGGGLAGTGYIDAPFSIQDNDGNWIDMTVTRSSAKKRNRIGVRSSANVKPLWPDTFIGDGQARIWSTMSPLQSKPIVRIDGAAAIVVDPDEISTKPYDFYWFGSSVVQNLAHPVLSGQTLTISYPSVLSFVAWAQDDADIAANGLFEGIEEVKDVATVEALQAIANALLARRKVSPVGANLRTHRDGLEPGMPLAVNTSRPLLNDTLLITQVSSSEVYRSRFLHTIQASKSNQAVSNDAAFFQQLIARSAQPKDRVRQNIVFHLAETLEGSTNPGLTVGVKTAVRAAPDAGYLLRATLYFFSSRTVPTTVPCVIDVFMGGVSIFGTPKMVWPAGATELQVKIEFAADPFTVMKNDLFTCEVLEADPLATDGVLELEMLVR